MIFLLRKTVQPEKQVSGLHFVMGTFLKVQVWGSSGPVLEQVRERIFQQIQELEERLSIYRPESEIAAINRAAGHSSVRVSAPTYDVVRQAIYFSQLTQGAFDPTIQPLTHLWGFDGFDGHLPEENEVALTREHVDYRQVILNPERSSVFLSRPGMGLDLGAIGKGFALDEALSRVKETPGVERITINFGGQFLFWSREGFFPAETVAIENPEGGLASHFDVRTNCSVSTSSAAERSFVAEDRSGRLKCYGHVLNPATGNPAEVVKSATVVALTATEAEVFSTALFVRGAEEGLLLLEPYPQIKAFLL